MQHRLYSTRTVFVLISALIAVALSACGSSTSTNEAHDTSTTTVAASADHNAQDVMFAQMMIVHHQSAITMAQLAESRASSQQVKALATRIEAEQAPEITTMTSWLDEWHAPTSLDQHGDAMHSMPGAMSEDQMNALSEASGSEFDQQFLELMAEHHQGAIEMAKTEQTAGKYQPAIDLAGSIVSTQTAEIEEITRLEGATK